MIARLNKSANTTRPRINFFDVRKGQDPFPDPNLRDPIDSDQNEQIRSDVKNISKVARENGISSEHASILDKILAKHLDVFRTTFSSGPAANIPPLKIDLVHDAKPVRVRLRNYSQTQKEFLAEFVNKLLDAGMVFPNPSSPWASAPLLVPKPGAQYLFTVGLRPVNKFTTKHQYLMPIIENELTKLSGSQFFANFDLSHGYCQLPLHKDSQVCQSFITPDGIYTLTQILHGTTNTVSHLQSGLATLLGADLMHHFLLWLDDMLLHHHSIDGFLNTIELFLTTCENNNIRLHPEKCIFFAKEIRWYGRLISSEGVKFDPRRLSSLLDMQPPSTGGQLQKFMCALQWVKQGIPNFTTLTDPLHCFLENIYSHCEKRTKRAVARVLLSDLGWGRSEMNAFIECKNALANQVRLSHRDANLRLCVYTDASEIAWSGIVTQVPYEDLNLPHAKQQHKPLAFLSGRFNATQLDWFILEKEAYAILSTLKRMHWMFATPEGFDIFTDFFCSTPWLSFQI